MKVDFINLHYYCVKDCDNEKGKSDFYKYIKSWRDWIDNDLKLSLPVVPIIFPMGLDNFSMLEYMLSYGKQRKKQVLKSVAHFRAKIQGNSEVFWP